MAGLLTFVSARGRAAAHRDAVVDALELLRHRGPDDTNVVVTDDVGVRRRPARRDGPRRRAAAGVVPADGRDRGGATSSCSTARSTTPTRCGRSWSRTGAPTSPPSRRPRSSSPRYHHWGPSAVSRLRGMFAFVIWDGSARRAFGARDPYGIKPLYQLTTADGVYLASERKALLPFVAEAAGRRGRPGEPAALPDDAVRARADHHAPRHPPAGRGRVLRVHPGRPAREPPLQPARPAPHPDRRRGRADPPDHREGSATASTRT